MMLDSKAMSIGDLLTINPCSVSVVYIMTLPGRNYDGYSLRKSWSFIC